MLNLKTYFSYKKFAGESLRIVYLNQSYFLQEESIRVLKELGHQVTVLPTAQDPKTMLEKLLKTCVQVKPDCIVSVNHFGFDYEGKIASVLSELDIPVLVWYLDDYRFIIPDGAALARPNVQIFTIEKNDIPHLHALGFREARYLPTASALAPHKEYRNPAYAYLNKAVVFIGGTFEQTRQRWFKEGYDQMIKDALPAGYAPAGDRYFIDMLHEKTGHLFKRKADFYHFAGFAAARATQAYRAAVLKNVSPCPLHIFGDPEWAAFNLPARLHPPADSGQTAPYIFNAALINLNISSVQLKTALNLRLYDVPVSGGFLLTDWKEDLDDLFDIKSEVAVYRSAEEMKEKIDYYTKNPQKRTAVIRRARERVVREHLLVHRLQKMLAAARKRFTQG